MTEWTTDYPTKRGFYWIRNYSILGKSETIGRSERTVAYVEKVRDGLSFWLFQWPDIFSRGQVMAAEWQGPIEPVTDADVGDGICSCVHRASNHARCNVPGCKCAEFNGEFIAPV